MLDISGQNVLIASPAPDKDRRIEVISRALIADSLVPRGILLQTRPTGTPTTSARSSLSTAAGSTSGIPP
ncbi:MAG TPA: hypothetical protein VD736_04260 [Nitrososphaera sp.]|nr:hypothetical protein [Nitrososphaera sp.]